MSLHKYMLDFSALATDERASLFERIDGVTYNGLALNPDTQTGTFLVDESFNVDSLKIPICCHLTRVHQ